MAWNDENQNDKDQPLIPPIGQPMLVPGTNASQPVVPPSGPMAMPAPPAMPSAPTAMPAMPIQPEQPARPAIQLPTPEKPAIQKLADKAAGIDNPFARILARTGTGILSGLEGIGEAAFPSVAMMIPGSEMHTALDNRRAERRAESEQAMNVNQEKADTEAETAKAAESRADTEAKKEAWDETHPKDQTGKTPEDVTIHDLMTGNNGQPRISPHTHQPYTYMEAYTDVMQAKQDTKPDKNNPTEVIKRKVGGVDHNILVDKTTGKDISDLGEIGEKAPQEPGSFMPLYDEKGHVVGAWNPKDGRIVKPPEGGLPGTTSQGQGISDKATAAQQKQIAPYKTVVDEANNAATLKDMADKGNAEADVGLVLSFFKAMRSGGQGIRFTQQEQSLITGARSLMDALEVKGNKVFSHGEPLAKAQRQQIMDVINVYKSAAQRNIDAITKGSGGSGGTGSETTPKKSFKEF
jgi:hypothetical protein